MDLFEDIFGVSDSESEEFFGFENEDISGSQHEEHVRVEHNDSDGSSAELSDEEQDRPPLLEDIVWSRNATAFEEPDFSPFVGPKNRPQNDSELGFFELFFTPEVLNYIVEQTNLYAVQENTGKAKKDPDWFSSNGEASELTVEELKAFFGVMIMMGIVRLPTIRDYWCEEDPFLYQPEIAKVFPRNRFLAILRYIHLNDNSRLPPQDDPNYKLYRVKPLANLLQDACFNRFVDYFPDARHLSIDEAMIKYKGRLSFIQYMPMKPVKRGIKVYCLCEAKTGYLIKFEIYVGRSVENAPARNSTENIVLSLLKNIERRNFYVFMDNWFTSIQLFLKLEELNIRACGTLRTNRKGFPQCLKEIQLKNQGDAAFAQSGNLVVTRWRDKAKTKPVTVLSSMYQAEGQDTVQRRRKGQDGRMQTIEINRPPNITQYCKYMGGVDLSDQNRSYYPVQTRRNIKWWKYVFYFLLDISIINAWVLRNSVLEKESNLDYRKFLAKQLIGRFTARKKVGRPRSLPVVAEVQHQYVQLLPGSKGKQCRNCQRKRKADRAAQREVKRPRESRFGCQRCDVVLCKGQCWLEWHGQSSSN